MSNNAFSSGSMDFSAPHSLSVDINFSGVDVANAYSNSCQIRSALSVINSPLSLIARIRRIVSGDTVNPNGASFAVNLATLRTRKGSSENASETCLNTFFFISFRPPNGSINRPL